MIIANAFSLQMIKAFPATFSASEISLDEVKSYTLESAVGHTDTANVLGCLIGQDIPANRIGVSLGAGDSIIVAQLTGGRLPEGATTLPDGFVFKFILVSVS